MNNFSTRQNVVNTMVVIDTAYIVGAYSNPSMDFEAPTPIDSRAAYMVAANGERLPGSGSQDILICAQPGDCISWFGAPESKNFNNDIIVYDATLENKTDMPSTPNFVQVEYNTIVPFMDYPQSSSIEQEGTAWYAAAVVLRRGEGVYSMQFALYTPGAKGGIEVYGYFQWNVTIRLLLP